MDTPPKLIHPTAEVEDGATVSADVRVWRYTHIRTGAIIRKGCNVGANVFIDFEVSIGMHCKIGNNALIYNPARVGHGCFIGPGVIITNDRHPKAVNKDNELLKEGEWRKEAVVIEPWASIGAGSILVAGIRIGQKAVIGAGSVVTKDVPPGETWAGNPAAKIK